jgi:hypothetical protein
MAKIILNNEEFVFTNYNRNTYFNEEEITSNGYINGISGENARSRLDALGQETITSIAIKNNYDITIYSLENIEANVTNIDESYADGQDNITISLNIKFNQ